MTEPTQPTEPVLVERRGPAGIVTLNRPDRMNAFSRELVDALHGALSDLALDDGVRAVVIVGAGDRAFCAGADLKERATMDESEVRRFVAKLQATMDLVATMGKPVIAAINGYAFGGGLELALACDLRLAASSAKMGLTETRLAIIPGAGGTQRLPRIVGIAKAKELIYTGRRISAQEAAEIGLINDVVADGSLVERAEALVAEIAGGGPLAIEQAKFAIDQGMNADLATGLAIERKAYEVIIPTEDRVEALEAFREKRKPEFKGR